MTLAEGFRLPFFYYIRLLQDRHRLSVKMLENPSLEGIRRQVS